MLTKIYKRTTLLAVKLFASRQRSFGPTYGLLYYQIGLYFDNKST